MPLSAQPFLRFVVLSLALAACRSHPATNAPPNGTAAALPDAPGPVQAQAAPATAARLAPAVRVAGTAGPGGEVAISVQNHAPEAVQLASALGVEERVEHGFRALAGAQVALHSAAAGEPCVQLAPGAELRPAPWRSAHEGTYRFVVDGCDRSYRIAGEPFELK